MDGWLQVGYDSNEYDFIWISYLSFKCAQSTNGYNNIRIACSIFLCWRWHAIYFVLTSYQSLWFCGVQRLLNPDGPVTVYAENAARANDEPLPPVDLAWCFLQPSKSIFIRADPRCAAGVRRWCNLLKVLFLTCSLLRSLFGAIGYELPRQGARAARSRSRDTNNNNSYPISW